MERLLIYITVRLVVSSNLGVEKDSIVRLGIVNCPDRIYCLCKFHLNQDTNCPDSNHTNRFNLLHLLWWLSLCSTHPAFYGRKNVDCGSEKRQGGGHKLDNHGN